MQINVINMIFLNDVKYMHIVIFKSTFLRFFYFDFDFNF